MRVGVVLRRSREGLVGFDGILGRVLKMTLSIWIGGFSRIGEGEMGCTKASHF